MGTITKKMTREEALKLKESYTSYEEKNTPPYAIYQIKVDSLTVTAYESGKVVFQDKNIDGHIGSKASKKEPSFKTNHSSNVYPQAGSDEVGTGDYFGPVVVCACYVSEDDISKLSDYGIQDTKEMKDSDIMEIGPILTQQLTHSLLVLDNTRYNQVHLTDNMNAIKAKLHNQAFIHLQNKLGSLPELSVIDQFAPPNLYFRYLQNEETVIRQLQFETKAENKFKAVACAAIIARYHFLIAFEQMGKYFNFEFPKGAGEKVDQAIKNFVDEHSRKELYKVAKVHFVNTENVLGKE